MFHIWLIGICKPREPARGKPRMVFPVAVAVVAVAAAAVVVVVVVAVSDRLLATVALE